jgi:plastocyanin
MSNTATRTRQLTWAIACLFLLLAPTLATQTQAHKQEETPQTDNVPATGEAATQPARIRGTVTLLSDEGERVRDRREMANAAIYFEPDEVPELNPPEDQVEMTTRRREFMPRVLTVVTGTEVLFPNEDPILHNVFSNSPGNQFDLGVYGESPGKSHHFNTAGIVRVYCNVHSRMSAHIVVVDSPYFVTPESDGTFILEDLPTGPGQLTVWHHRANPQRTRIDLEPGSEHIHNIELPLTVRQAAPQRERFRRRGRY